MPAAQYSRNLSIVGAASVDQGSLSRRGVFGKGGGRDDSNRKSRGMLKMRRSRGTTSDVGPGWNYHLLLDNLIGDE